MQKYITDADVKSASSTLPKNDFPESATTALPVVYRTYARKENDATPRESVDDVKSRVLAGLFELGSFTEDEQSKIRFYFENNKLFPSGRALWCLGTEFSKEPKNFYSLYNCNNIRTKTLEDMGDNFEFLMMGSGVGEILEVDNVNELPPITSKINLNIKGYYGLSLNPIEKTKVSVETSKALIEVGDSREGWVSSYVELLKLATNPNSNTWDVTVDVSSIRESGKVIKGFGGRSNPIGFIPLLDRVVEITNNAVGRQLKPIEVSMLLNEAAKCTVAGNVRRSAKMQQFSQADIESGLAKTNLWTQDSEGNWKADTAKDALRMSNFTRIWHSKPTHKDILEALKIQFNTAEGAIMYAPEAIARANADLLDTHSKKKEFINLYCKDKKEGEAYLVQLAGGFIEPDNLDHRMHRYGLNPCFAAGTMILTKEGSYPIEKLLGKSVEVWDGESWQPTIFRITGRNQDVHKLTLYSGEEIYATPYHTFILQNGKRVKLNELTPNDKLQTHSVQTYGNVSVKGAYLKGFLLGDGTSSNNNALLNLYSPKYCCQSRLLDSAKEIQAKVPALVGNGSFSIKTNVEFCDESNGNKFMSGLSARTELYDWVTTYRDGLPKEIYSWDKASKLEFIAGLFDADGSQFDTKNGFAYQLTNVNQTMLKDVQLLLKSIGVFSHFGLMKKAEIKDFGSTRGGAYQTKDCYKLTISQASSVKLASLVTFSRLPSFAEKTLKNKSAPRWNKVKSIEFSHVADYVYCCTVDSNHTVGLTNGLLTGQCGEIIGSNYFCNLIEVHANQLDPCDLEEQKDVFYVAGLEVASLLSHQFTKEQYRFSREIDPIVGVSFTGLFDFFVNMWGVEWLEWWQGGRSREHSKAHYFLTKEAVILTTWKNAAEQGVSDYCKRNDLNIPNRFTTVQPAGTKSLLTGASPGWHPPKSSRYIRRITFAKDDPVALACIDYGYNVVPSQSDKDEYGNLLNDPFDPRCTEWLVEIPFEIPWANEPGCDQIDPSKFSVKSQFDFYMQVQNHYTTHNTSATLEYRESEIEEFADILYQTIQEDKGYISAAMMARFDANETMPRLPFEPINKERYEHLISEIENRRESDDFYALLLKHDTKVEATAGPAGCDSDKCFFPSAK